VIDAGSGSRMARLRQTILLLFFERKFLNALFLHPFFEKFLKQAWRRLFKDLLTRNLRDASYNP
jgi:hypothetical protein